MGVRRDKGNALARYIVGSTGIPFIRWEGVSLHAPSPYLFDVTTSRSLDNWHRIIREIDDDKPRMVIRYDNTLPDVSHAWVGMKLNGFLPLLTAHYESIQDRIKGE